MSGKGYFCNTTGGAFTATLPASPSAGDIVGLKDYAATFGSNALTVGRNSSNIQGAANDSKLSTDRASVVLVYVDSTKGWLYVQESNVSNLGPTYISATGGTITTSGDYKIHTFTSTGTFTVSSVGNSAILASMSALGIGVVPFNHVILSKLFPPIQNSALGFIFLIALFILFIIQLPHIKYMYYFYLHNLLMYCHLH